LTADGYESQFQVNYLSHFLLTQLLLPKLKIAAQEEFSTVRIVATAGAAQEHGNLNFQDLQSK